MPPVTMIPTLCELAFSQIPEGQKLPDVVFQTTRRGVASKIRDIHKKIDKNKSKYIKAFDQYTNVLDPQRDILRDFAFVHGYTSLYEVLAGSVVGFRHEYNTFPVDIDEGNDWFAYLEYMNFRVFPAMSVWEVHDYHTVIHIVRGIMYDMNRVPVPDGPCPESLIVMRSYFLSYRKHLENFLNFFESRYSSDTVFVKQKKYVETYKKRTESDRPLKLLLEFYKGLKAKYRHYVFIPSILLNNNTT